MHGSFYEDVSSFLLGKCLAEDLWVPHGAYLFRFTFPLVLFPVLGILAVLLTLAIEIDG